MSRPENTTGINLAQHLMTVESCFGNTPIDNRGLMVFNVAGGTNIEDALETAKTLSSGLGQICDHLHDSLNMGEMAYCDGVKTLAFIAEAVSALVWSVQRGMKPRAEGEVRQ
ncbi:hypothetical protein [Pseudomonas abietaniphila]|uniref:DUF3077 domain-containing protein n=1 Tax=Pseudomonas abietaniphila TaxID=89065 RepID=A0A1G8KDL1_9PSED|nr:hypothetical protein [Pseudomonas abietaniphila]SDI40920.1 hypothetical protein SAMN05216605_11344 [Pseudomonas abietaniphila]